MVDERTVPGFARPPDSLRAELMRQRLRARMFGEPGSPATIGRFRVIEAIGSGGMGTVYLGWDDVLARSVALKLLHQRESDELLDEAQALARLSHPNVVAVFDVGVHEGRVYLAMEHVPGQTLRAWQDQRPSRARLLAAWLAAGHGLAAVHAAGLIHRDVKPDNVLLGDDGRVRLIDFGLVLAPEGEPTCDRALGLGGDSTARLGFAGTREYAAPEQRAGASIDHRADQYAFCVSVWEALAGSRPARDPNGRLLAAANPKLERRVIAALQRGLAVSPGDRWPSMPALLDALAPRRRRIDVVIAAATALVIGGSVGVLARDDSSPTVDRCASAGADLELEVAATLAEGPLRDAVQQWIAEFRATAARACEDHEQTGLAAVLAQRSACLEYRRAELSRLLDHLAAVRAGSIELDSRRLALGDPRACLRAPEQALAMPGQHVEVIAELRRAIAELDRQGLDGAVALLPEGERLLERAQAIGWPPLIGEALLVLARLELRASEPEQAHARIGELLDLADRHGQSELTIEAWHTLTELAGDLALDPDAAHWAWQRQRAALDRLGSTALDRGNLAIWQARIASLRGDAASSEAALREAIAELEQAGLGGRVRLMIAVDRLASVVGAAGRLDEMQALRERALALEHELAAGSALVPDASLGEADRAFGQSQIALASGDHDRAIAGLEQALLGYQRASGSESQQVAQTHVALAQVHDAVGALDQAQRHAERADAICLARLGSEHPLRAASLSALGTIALRRGDPQAAVRSFSRALQIEQRHGRAGVDAALARSNLAEALIAAGNFSEARWQAEQALTELAVHVAADHPDLAYPHKALGWALLELGELGSARRHLDRALALTSWSVVEVREIEALLARAG